MPHRTGPTPQNGPQSLWTRHARIPSWRPRATISEDVDAMCVKAPDPRVLGNEPTGPFLHRETDSGQHDADLQQPES